MKIKCIIMTILFCFVSSSVLAWSLPWLNKPEISPRVPIPAEEENIRVIAEWGSIITEGSDDGYFGSPISIEIDKLGQVYIGDTIGRIQIFTNNGSFVKSFYLNYPIHDPPYENYAVPGAFTLDSEGNIYVIDRRYYRYPVMVFDNNGVFIRQLVGPASFSVGRREGIIINSENEVFISDKDRHKIQVYRLDGTPIIEWGSEGVEAGRFLDGPRDIAIDSSGYIYAIDASQVHVFTQDGRYLREWVIDRERCLYPYEITIDSYDNIYILGGHYTGSSYDAVGYVCIFGKDGEFKHAFNYSPSRAVPTEDSIAAQSLQSIFVVYAKDSLVKKFSFTVKPSDFRRSSPIREKIGPIIPPPPPPTPRLPR